MTASTNGAFIYMDELLIKSGPISVNGLINLVYHERGCLIWNDSCLLILPLTREQIEWLRHLSSPLLPRWLPTSIIPHHLHCSFVHTLYSADNFVLWFRIHSLKAESAIVVSSGLRLASPDEFVQLTQVSTYQSYKGLSFCIICYWIHAQITVSINHWQYLQLCYIMLSSNGQLVQSSMLINVSRMPRQYLLPLHI